MHLFIKLLQNNLNLTYYAIFSHVHVSPRAGLSPQHVSAAQPDGVRVAAAAAVHHDGGVGLPHRPARRHR